MIHNFTILLLELFALFLFLMGYFQVKTTFEDVNLTKSSNNKPMKVIFLLIDAFRIDFFANSNFSFYEEMKAKQFDYQILYYGISSVPTVTELNLQAMTIGNFPSFIDFSQNMNAKSLKEDNIIKSMKRANKKLALVGDDTWLKMFPTEFDSKKTIQSFDVRDLDGADNMVFNNIFSLMDQEFDFIVAHLLGIDHTGHSFNDSNSALWSKQFQYNQLLYQVYNKLDNNTMLFVIGDHGMSEYGNHGGRSTKEISSTIYAINKQYKFNRSMFTQSFNNIQYTDDLLIERQEFVRQGYNINLASTIAYLMGISIPFSNIGAMFSEIIHNYQEQGCKENLNQIIQYLNKFETYESYQYNIKESNNCQDIQQSIIDLQIDIKTKFTLYDYFYLIIGITLLISSFIIHFAIITDSKLKERFINQKRYIIYRLEIYVVIPVLCFVSILYFNLALKIISIYILFLVLQSLFLSLIYKTNFTEFFWRLVSSEHKRLFFVILNIFVQKGIQDAESNRQIVTSTNIFGTLANIFIMILISQFQTIKYLYLPVISSTLLIIAEQYNQKFNPKYPYSPLLIEEFKPFFQSFWLKFLIPAIFLQIFMFKFVNKKMFSFLLFISQILQIYNNYTFQVNEHVWIIKRGLPLFLYFSSIFFLIKNRDLTYVFLIILTVSGENGMISYCCLFYSIYLLEQFYNKLSSKQWSPIILGATIQLMLNYFWQIEGHRMVFDNVKFKDALIGFESYNIIYNNILLTLSIFGIFFIIDVIQKILNQDKKVIQSLILFQFYQLLFTCIENSLNLYNQNIIESFAQKLVFESLIFIILVVNQIISISFKHLNFKIQETLDNEYDVFHNEIHANQSKE